MFTKSWILRSALVAGIGLAAVGCESHAGNDALIGGAAGAGIGALVGSVSHARAGEGALIGGAIGAIGGGLVGNEQDRREHYQERAYRDDGYYRQRPVYYEDRYYYEPRPVVVRERRVYRYDDSYDPRYDYRR
jgi:uncharacterized protein YcfJ